MHLTWKLRPGRLLTLGNITIRWRGRQARGKSRGNMVHLVIKAPDGTDVHELRASADDGEQYPRKRLP